MMWYYLVPLQASETPVDAYIRIFKTLILSLIPGFGRPIYVSHYTTLGKVVLEQDISRIEHEWQRLLLESLPVDLSGDGSWIRVAADVQAADGTYDRDGYAIRINLEPDDGGAGIQLDVSMKGTVFYPPDDDAHQDSIDQYSHNGPKLTRFLRLLRTTLQAEFAGRDYDVQGPDGFLPAGADQTGLPAP